MILLLPGLITSLIYFLASVLPGIFLLRYIYKRDIIEKEPRPLLITLLFLGALAALCAGIVENILGFVLATLVTENTVIYTILYAFIVIAAVEEGAKFFFLYVCSWRSPAFNYRFDGIVYAVFVSLGFAILENVNYVFSYGISVALPRALLAVPAHMAFGVFMGAYYGRAKLAVRSGQPKKKHPNMIIAFILATLLHGFYDACAMLGTTISMIIFVIYVVIMYIVVITRVKKEYTTDHPL